MKWQSIFLLMCVITSAILMTYMTRLYDHPHYAKIVRPRPTVGPPIRRSWPPADWWRPSSSKLRGSTSKRKNLGKEKIPDTTPSSVPENVTGDVIPPIAFDANTSYTISHDIEDKTEDPTSCTHQDNVVFIKTHKTGSTSLSHIVNRYGFTHNLSFVFNRLSPTNGHLVYLPLNANSPRTHFLPPIGVRPGDFSKYKYNMLAVHVRYNRKAMDTFMKPNTHYITIIRDPGTQFESAFTHFQLDDSFLMQEKMQYTTMKARLTQFFAKPDFYRKRLKSMKWEGKMGLRWYYAKNNQAFDLGLDHVYHNDKTKVEEYIKKLDREFRLVLITEYFEESLVVMRRLLCWSLEETLYVAKNVRPNPANIPESLRNKMRQWNNVDTQLYEHFNRTLWEKISRYGPDFQTDLSEFRRRLKETFESCVGGTEVKAQGHYFHWIEYKPRKDSNKLCAQIAESKNALFSAIWRRQQIPVARSPPKPRSRNMGLPFETQQLRRYPSAKYILSRHKPPKQIKPPPKAAAAKGVSKGAGPPPPKAVPASKPLPPQPAQKIIRHVILANKTSNSQPGVDEMNDDDSSSVLVVHETAKMLSDKLKSERLINVTAEGTRVKPVLTYKKNR
ncbi:uncharacterized protein LOC121430080 [Lytechinus variegatus]|uniref:uncharacterized protein LOC121430080 n=1 Tax=Lytechinus variegatus TaxID=7654 RepID=UPI001BB11A89|nr:uncharacterized protein LOC121430080 [Lytechinus variegatus]